MAQEGGRMIVSLIVVMGSFVLEMSFGKFAQLIMVFGCEVE